MASLTVLFPASLLAKLVVIVLTSGCLGKDVESERCGVGCATHLCYCHCSLSTLVTDTQMVCHVYGLCYLDNLHAVVVLYREELE